MREANPWSGEGRAAALTARNDSGGRRGAVLYASRQMSGLETLPPDQRAVLQLILQGRRYEELAGVLRIDATAVRARALAGLEALAGGAPADPERRARIADYLLGQQDEGERIVTLAELGESADASRWATALRDQLAPLARDELPGVLPSNGTAAAAPPPAPAPVAPPPQPPQLAQPPLPTETGRARIARPQPNRLGGALLLAAAAAAIVVLAIAVLTGGDDEPTTAARTTDTPAATQPSTTPSQPSSDVLGQVNLIATPAGGQAAGIGIVQEAGGQLGIAVQAQRLPANGARDVYAVWIDGAPGARLLGFVPRQVRRDGGRFSVAAVLPDDARRYDAVLITRESTEGGDTPAQPGETIMRGALRMR
jgi:hypothetical protein